MDAVQDRYGQAAQQFRKGYDQAADSVRHGYKQTEEMIKDRPTESAAVCFGVGMLCGVFSG